jgi:hypothetical protein
MNAEMQRGSRGVRVGACGEEQQVLPSDHRRKRLPVMNEITNYLLGCPNLTSLLSKSRLQMVCFLLRVNFGIVLLEVLVNESRQLERTILANQ